MTLPLCVRLGFVVAFLGLVWGDEGATAEDGGISAEVPVEQQSNSSQQEEQKKTPESFVVVITDQDRYETAYEGEEAAAYRKSSFKGERLLCEQRPCVRFTRHYTAATSATPAKGSLYTGLFARVHQALQSVGLKQADDSDMHWLDPSIATMGDYFHAAGYDTAHFGEWHLSSETWQSNLTRPNLEKYGFSTWMEPNLKSPERSEDGLSKDDLVVGQATRWLEERAKRPSAKPFLLVVNLNSPGLIQHWPTTYKHLNQGRAGLQGGPGHQVPIPGLPKTMHEDLSAKSTTSRVAPRFLDSALEHTPRFMQRWRGYAQAYMLFQKDADDHLAHLVRTVEATFPMSTVVRTSDRGEMGGAHGSMRGTWYNGYEESIHVPLIISGPLVAAQRGDIDDISSSVDVLPTMLAMAQADMQVVQKDVFSSHRADLLPGRNLLVRIPEKEQVAYFETYDHVTRHDQAIMPLVQILGPYPLKVPWLRTLLSSEELDTMTNIEAVVAKPGGDTRAGYPGRGGKVWKFIRFWDDPERWSQPAIVHEPRRGAQSGRFYRVRKRTQPHEDELELYDLDNDPLEEDNLAYNVEYHAVLVSMQSVLNLTRPHAVPALPASSESKLPGKSESEMDVGTFTAAVSAVLYLIKRTEREFPYATLKVLLGVLLSFRIIGPYRLTKRLLAQFAMPLNMVSGVLNSLIGVTLMCNHEYVFPPFLPLLPDALAHESVPVYIILGVFTTLCGATRLAWVIYGTWQGASTLSVCMTWLAEWAVVVLLLRITPSLDVLDFLWPFAVPLLAISSTLCLGDRFVGGWSMFFVRGSAVSFVLVLLLFYGLTQIFLQQGLITDRMQVLDSNWITLTLQSTQVRESDVVQSLQASREHLQNFAEPVVSKISGLWK